MKQIIAENMKKECFLHTQGESLRVVTMLMLKLKWGGGVHIKSYLSIFAYAHTTSFWVSFSLLTSSVEEKKLCLKNMLTSNQESPPKTTHVQTKLYNQLLFVITFIGNLPIIV